MATMTKTQQAKSERSAAKCDREASQAVMRQLVEIAAAMEVLAATVERITSTINPESCNWRDVSEHAMTAEFARKLESANLGIGDAAANLSMIVS